MDKKGFGNFDLRTPLLAAGGAGAVVGAGGTLLVQKLIEKLRQYEIRPKEASMDKSAEMTREEAVLYQHVYVPVFIEKCASRGVQLSQADLGLALETTALVKSAMERQQGSQIKTANANLKKILGVEPIEAAQKAHAKTASLAKQLGQKPEVREAILKGLGLAS